MNTSKNISLSIYKNLFWTWLHLGSAVLLNAALYSTLRILEFSTNASLGISALGITIGLILPFLFFPQPNQTRVRFYWTLKIIYQIQAILTLIISIQNIYLLLIWAGTLVLVWSIFIVGIFIRHFNLAKDEIERNTAILNRKMEENRLSPYKVALLTGIEESRILRFTRGEARPSAEEAAKLKDFFSLSEEQLKNHNQTFR